MNNKYNFLNFFILVIILVSIYLSIVLMLLGLFELNLYGKSYVFTLGAGYFAGLMLIMLITIRELLKINDKIKQTKKISTSEQNMNGRKKNE